MHARYFASAQGRFSSADTVPGSITNPQTLNLYAYVQNNPLTFNDPTGHISDDHGMFGALSGSFRRHSLDRGGVALSLANSTRRSTAALYHGETSFDLTVQFRGTAGVGVGVAFTFPSVVPVLSLLFVFVFMFVVRVPLRPRRRDGLAGVAGTSGVTGGAATSGVGAAGSAGIAGTTLATR
jgi:hypothetical protein